MNKEKRKKGEELKRRFNAIKNLMSTFAMATVAVVAVAIFVPTSPKAEIIKAASLSNEIVYQVNVTDEDNALNSSTLFVVLENQLEYYEQKISLGENSGYFDDLKANTEYRLSVYGSKGFGQERLDTTKITTSEQVGGTILAVTPETIDFSTTYNVNISIYDPDQKYSNIELYYGYQWEPDTDLQYSSVQVSTSRIEIELNDIYTDLPIHIYLEATTENGVEVLDEIWVTPPFRLYSSVYMEYINRSQVKFHLYEDMDVGDIHYIMNIYKNNFLLRTDSIILEENQHHGSGFIVDNLNPDTTYMFECIATYTNPQTLAEEQIILYQEEITTLSDYNYTYNKEIFDDYIEITFTLNDPFDYFQYIYVETYDTSEEFEMFLESNSYDFIEDGVEKTISLTINIPTAASYKIYISMQNQSNFNIRHLIDTIKSE
ncbi:MAG: hypothetical protein K9L64_06805 [Candidatus Izimaplasma sp.]|nr:hypothetical protein [Candidatus Izimaplasma bacterium]